MGGLKKLNTRIVNKHATAAIWNDTNFTPLQGEFVIYDPGYDSKDGKTYTVERVKVGDGTHTIQELPFLHELQANVDITKETVNVVTSVGTPTYVSSSFVAPSMGQTCSEGTLTITFDPGSYTPAVFTPGEIATTKTIEYVSDVDIDVNVANS